MKRERTHHRPAVLDTHLLPGGADLAVVVQAPDGRDLLAELRAQDVAHRATRVAVAGGKEEDVCDMRGEREANILFKARRFLVTLFFSFVFRLYKRYRYSLTMLRVLARLPCDL